ncbi:unnamed protein product [Ectocarpus sp. 6 AP-2014]
MNANHRSRRRLALFPVAPNGEGNRRAEVAAWPDARPPNVEGGVPAEELIRRQGWLMMAHPPGFQHHRNHAEQHQEPSPSTSAGSLTGKSGIDITVFTDVSLVGENPEPPCAPSSIPVVMGTAAAAWTQNPFCGWSPLPLR